MQSCTKIGEGGAVETSTRYSGTLRPRTFDVRAEGRTSRDGDDIGSGTRRIMGERVQDCPLPIGVPPTKADHKHVVAVPAQPVRPVYQTPALPPIAAKSAQSIPADSGDILVVARKLRRLRLRYRTSGRTLASCQPDVSSGDPRLDRMGCAILRACIREGAEEQDRALKCFRRKVDELNPD
jgi:hypothetical protein